MKDEKSLAKMSPKLMGCDAKRIREKNAPDHIDLCEIYGVVAEEGIGTDRTGRDYKFLTGDFKGFNLAEADQPYVSNKLFLPSGMHEQVVTNLKLNAGAQNGLTTFGYRISVRADVDSSVGYVFDCVNLVKSKRTDILGELEREIEANRQPAKDHKTEAAKTEPAKTGKGR